MDLRTQGLVNVGPVHAQLAPARSIELALARNEGMLADNGAFVAKTGTFTGRAAKDKYLVRRPSSEAHIALGPVNQPMDPPTSNGSGSGPRLLPAPRSLRL